MKVNGIDLVRVNALTAAGIDPHGPMVQYRDVLGAAYVFCNQHLGVHRTDGSCTVHAFEKFPLATTGGWDDAHTEVRQRGFHLHGEPCPCRSCGATIIQDSDSGYTWVTVEGRSGICSPSSHGGHTAVEAVPSDAATRV